MNWDRARKGLKDSTFFFFVPGAIMYLVVALMGHIFESILLSGSRALVELVPVLTLMSFMLLFLAIAFLVVWVIFVVGILFRLGWHVARTAAAEPPPD